MWYARIGKVTMKSTDVHKMYFIKQKVLQTERITHSYICVSEAQVTQID